jgi:4-hydroxy-2-oxoheptanedioate aldolase
VAAEGLKALWRDGGTALGAWLFLREPLVAEAASKAGYDYVCIDMQHGLQDYADAVAMLQAVATGPATPMVRVPANEPGIIGRVLDAGALAVVVPLVNSAEEAVAAVAACRYPPAGTRSMGPVGASTRHGADYFGRADELVACIPMIETRQAVERADEILAVPGIDAVYVGPADLSISYGLPPRNDNPGDPFDPALAAVLDACRRHGVVPGVHADPSLAGKRSASGFRIISVGYDLGNVMGGLRRDLASSREAVEGGEAP